MNDFEKLVKSVRNAIKQAYNFKRKNKGRDIKWKGPQIHKSMRASSLNFDERLSAHNLKFSKMDQDRDALDEIIIIAIQVGIGQGRQTLAKEISVLANCLEKNKISDMLNKLLLEEINSDK